jgi:predicted nucleic acid-binding protein
MSEDVGNHYIDSTVLLDFFLVNALSHFLKLPFRIVTVDIMAADLEVPNLDQIGKAGVIILETPDHVLEQMGATGVVNGISVYDAAILLAAKSRKAVLLSGDEKLRKAAAKERVACRGTLWLLEEMVLGKIITPGHAVLLLERMFLIGRRLPADEGNRRIIAWEGGGR